jgi:hypothetical protein
MASSPRLTDLRNAPPSLVTPGNGDWQRPVRPPRRPPTARPFRLRFDRGVGYCLGGVVLGTAGCLLGARMPYYHPVAVALSVVWWGLFWGGFGTWLGALVGMLAETAPAAASQGPDVKADRSVRSGGPRRPGMDRSVGLF